MCCHLAGSIPLLYGHCLHTAGRPMLPPTPQGRGTGHAEHSLDAWPVSFSPAYQHYESRRRQRPTRAPGGRPLQFRPLHPFQRLLFFISFFLRFFFWDRIARALAYNTATPSSRKIDTQIVRKFDCLMGWTRVVTVWVVSKNAQLVGFQVFRRLSNEICRDPRFGFRRFNSNLFKFTIRV